MRRAERWALRAYPPSFRDRYGAELAALTEDVGSSWRHTVDLVVGAARAWLLPAFTGAEATGRRMRATVSTVWVAWCGGCLVAPAMVKAILDPPGPTPDPTARHLLDASVVALGVGWLLALAGALLVGRAALVPVLRAREWPLLHRALRPLLPALVLGVAEAAGLVVLATVASPVGSGWSLVLAASWLAGLVALLATAGVGPALALGRLRPPAASLRLPTLLAAALAACLATTAATGTAAVVVAGDAAQLLGGFGPVAAVATVGAIAAAAALVSSARGVHALARPDLGR